MENRQKTKQSKETEREIYQQITSLSSSLAAAKHLSVLQQQQKKRRSDQI